MDLQSHLRSANLTFFVRSRNNFEYNKPMQWEHEAEKK